MHSFSAGLALTSPKKKKTVVAELGKWVSKAAITKVRFNVSSFTQMGRGERHLMPGERYRIFVLYKTIFYDSAHF